MNSNAFCTFLIIIVVGLLAAVIGAIIDAFINKTFTWRINFTIILIGVIFVSVIIGGVISIFSILY